MNDAFDPSAVAKNQPWIERAIEAFAPTWGLRRMEARVSRALFDYNAARATRIYNPKTNGQPSESSQVQRDRVVMLWEARDLCENFPAAREVPRKVANYLTVTEYSPTTGDKAYNQTVQNYFHDWCKVCDVTGRHSFKKLVQLAVEHRTVDGDCGFALRRVKKMLKLQLVPGTLIGDPNMMSMGADSGYYQGVQVNAYGMPTSYRIFKVKDTGVYYDPEEISADSFVHFFDPYRVDQYRGITDFHAAIRTARMLGEILEAEKVGVRFATQQAALVFSDRGTATTRNLFAPNPSQTMANGQVQQNELTEAGMIRYLGAGDKVEVMPSRPSSAFAGFVDHLMKEIALGVGWPAGVLYGTDGYKGPNVRAEFAAADRVATEKQGILTDKVLDPIKDAVLLNAIAEGELEAPPKLKGETMAQALKRATRGEWRFPAKLTIDVGRESAANLNENRQGAKSLQEIAAEEGTDAFSRLEQIAIEASYVKELANKYGVPETAIRLVTNSLPSTPAAAAAAGDAVGVSAAEAQAASVAPAPAPAEPAPAEPVEQVENSANLVTINFADGSYIPTQAMADNARRALEIREKKPMSQRGMTSVGIARARDLMNKRPMSEDTVRRMKAFFDRHEVDKQGATWDEQGKGYQAWMGWGGDEGYSWATAIVERLNKAQDKKSLAVSSEQVQHHFALKTPLGSADWLDAVQKYRAKQLGVIEQTKQSVIGGRSIIELAKKQYDLPTPNAGEDHGDFMTRCMADPVSTAEFPDAEQRNAVCMRQHEGHFAKVGERGAIVASDKAPKSSTPNKDPSKHPKAGK